MISINIEPQHIQSLFTVHFFVRDHQVHAVARRDKTCPRIQKHLQNPKHVPQSSNTSQNWKTRPRTQNTSQNPKHVPKSRICPRNQNTPQNPTHFPESKSVLESRKYFEFLCFWFFGMGFGFLQKFWDSGTCSGFWEVFCSYEPQWVRVLSVRSGHPGE